MDTIYRTKDGKEFKYEGSARNHEAELAAIKAKKKAELAAVKAELDAAKAKRKAPLSARQKQVLDVIVEFRASHGYSPTQLDLAAILGISHVAVLFNIRELVAKGALKHVAKKAIQIGKEVPYTQKQLAVVNCFLANPNACQKQVADLMGISAPSLHRHIESLVGLKAVKIMPTDDPIRTRIEVLDSEAISRANAINVPA